MEIGLREWLVIGGVLLISLIILDGWRRMNSNRSRLKMDIDPAAADLPEEPVRSHNPELPNGGSRVVGEEQDPLFQDNGEPITDPLDVPEPRLEQPIVDGEKPHIEPTFNDDMDLGDELGPVRVVSSEQAKSVETPESEPESALPEQLTAPVPEKNKDKEPVVVPVEPVEQITPLRPDTSDLRDEVRAKTEAVPETNVTPFPNLNMYEAGESPEESSRDKATSVSDLLTEAANIPEPEPVLASMAIEERSSETQAVSPVTPEAPASDNSDQLDFDPDKPISLMLDEQSEPDTPQPAEPEPISLFATEPEVAPAPQEPITPVQQPKTAKKVKRKEPQKEEKVAEPEPAPVTKDLFAERPSLEKQPDPESVLVITVLAQDEKPITGDVLLPLVKACGMCFGDMHIFHRFEDGLDQGAVQFSMANAVNPGTFNVTEMDEMDTRGLTFFMSMEEPRDIMNAFDCMLATAETVAKHFEAELLDEHRSVLRPQTKEHYRQRIRDYEMRNLSRRVH